MECMQGGISKKHSKKLIQLGFSGVRRTQSRKETIFYAMLVPFRFSSQRVFPLCSNLKLWGQRIIKAFVPYFLDALREDFQSLVSKDMSYPSTWPAQPCSVPYTALPRGLQQDPSAKPQWQHTQLESSLSSSRYALILFFLSSAKTDFLRSPAWSLHTRTHVQPTRTGVHKA